MKKICLITDLINIYVAIDVCSVLYLGGVCCLAPRLNRPVRITAKSNANV